MVRSESPRPPVVALLTDFWYTLAYYGPGEQRLIERNRRRTWREALEAAGVPARRSRPIVADLERRWQAEEAEGRTPPLAERIPEVARSLGVSLDGPALIEALDGVVRAHPPHLASGATAALRRLRAHGVRIGIVSNVLFESAAGARRLLDRLRLLELVDAIALSADDGVAKPDPRPIRRCLAQLRVPSARARFVGDMPTDMAAARAAGVPPIRFRGLATIGPAAAFPAASFGRTAFAVHRWGEVSGRLLAPHRPTRPTRADRRVPAANAPSREHGRR